VQIVKYFYDRFILGPRLERARLRREAAWAALSEEQKAARLAEPATQSLRELERPHPALWANLAEKEQKAALQKQGEAAGEPVEAAASAGKAAPAGKAACLTLALAAPGWAAQW
jgi:hypothetical protein